MTTMKTTRTTKWTVGLALVVGLFGGAALAKNKAQCKRDVKEFIKQCEKVCGQQLEKKNPKAAEGCRKNCQDQSAAFEKECDK